MRVAAASVFVVGVVAILTAAGDGCTIFSAAAPCDTDVDCRSDELCVGKFCAPRTAPTDSGVVTDAGAVNDAGSAHDAGVVGEGEGEGDGEGEGEGAGEGEGGAVDAGPADAGFVDAGPPPASCAEVLARDPTATTGEYSIVDLNGAQNVFCDMTRRGGGWTRVVLDDYTNGSPCPAGWLDIANDNVVGCRRSPGNELQASASFPVPIAYTELLGSVQGLGFANLDAFGTSQNNIDGNYVDGVSITTAAPRQHLFTLAASHKNTSDHECPCDSGPGARGLTSGNFACDRSAIENVFDTSAPLWDDVMRCLPPGSTDRFFQSGTLAAPTTQNIELRIMADQSSSDEDFAVIHVELYVR